MQAPLHVVDPHTRARLTHCNAKEERERKLFPSPARTDGGEKQAVHAQRNSCPGKPTAHLGGCVIGGDFLVSISFLGKHGKRGSGFSSFPVMAFKKTGKQG